MKYLVTGATGRFAGYAIKELSELVGVSQIVGTVRSLDKAHKLKELGIELRQADYFDLKSLIEAFKGIDRVLFISSGSLERRTEQHKNVVTALKKSGVEFVAYTSFPYAEQSKSSLASDHRQTEHFISDAKLDHAFLRNNWYLENETSTILGAANQQPIYYSSAEGLAGWALKEDYAKAAARVLVQIKGQKAVYEFGGPLITYGDLAGLINQVVSKPVAVNAVTDEGLREHLKTTPIPEAAIDFVIAGQDFIKEGDLAVSSEDLSAVLGRPVTPLTKGIEALLEGK